MNGSEVALSVLIDYYKALDTIDHCILLGKTPEYELCEKYY